MSRSGKRWVVPKGHIEVGQTAGETALQEAWEEAGLVGTLRSEPIGSYHYKKCGTVCHVTVFVMHVTQVSELWPECRQRLRLWLSPEQALARIEEPGLQKLLAKVLRTEARERAL
jgi:8-oxo-dGTP pyrophosphatase MutT (NUDIX family)